MIFNESIITDEVQYRPVLSIGMTRDEFVAIGNRGDQSLTNASGTMVTMSIDPDAEHTKGVMSVIEAFKPEGENNPSVHGSRAYEISFKADYLHRSRIREAIEEHRDEPTVAVRFERFDLILLLTASQSHLDRQFKTVVETRVKAILADAKKG